MGDEDLRGDASAIVGDEVDGVDVEVIEESGEHRGLGVRRDGLIGMRFGEAEPHEIEGDAAAVRVEALEGSAPLIAVEWVTVEEESGGAMAYVDAGDACHGEIEEAAVAVVPGRVEGDGLSRDDVWRGDDRGKRVERVFEEVSASHDVSLVAGAEICAHVWMGVSTNGWEGYASCKTSLRRCAGEGRAPATPQLRIKSCSGFARLRMVTGTDPSGRGGVCRGKRVAVERILADAGCVIPVGEG